MTVSVMILSATLSDTYGKNLSLRVGKKKALSLNVTVTVKDASLCHSYTETQLLDRFQKHFCMNHLHRKIYTVLVLKKMSRFPFKDWHYKKQNKNILYYFKQFLWFNICLFQHFVNL